MKNINNKQRKHGQNNCDSNLESLISLIIEARAMSPSNFSSSLHIGSRMLQLATP